MDGRLVIVGAGHAGGSLAGQLRQQGYRGPIVLLGRESSPPYMRPPLSKAWLKGEAQEQDLLLRAPAFYAEQDIDLRLGCAVQDLSLQDRRLRCADGSEVAFDHLVLATGARARELDLPGRELQGVHLLRELGHARALKQALAGARRLAIVGGGFIGLEVAATARALGVEAVVLEQQSRLLSRLASATLSDHLAHLHRSRGVAVELGVQVQAMLGETAVRGVRLGDGRELEADVVLVGVGSAPNTELLQRAGLDCADGIPVDESARSPWPRVYAIGDVSVRTLADGARRRLESVPSALEQARQLALHLCGRPPAEPDVPWFWSDQYEAKLQMAGLAGAGARTHVLGDVRQGRFCVLHLQGARLQAVECVNAPADFMQARKAIAQGRELDLDKLDGAGKLAAALAAMPA